MAARPGRRRAEAASAAQAGEGVSAFRFPLSAFRFSANLVLAAGGSEEAGTPTHLNGSFVDSVSVYLWSDRSPSQQHEAHTNRQD